MEKKTYMAPATEVVGIETEQLMNTVSGSNGIGYGGVDGDGTKVPASRAFDNLDLDD